MKNRKILFSLLTLGICTSVYAQERYNVIVSPNDTEYKVVDSYIPTGEINCSIFSPLESEVYKDRDFVQTQSGCLETYRTNGGDEKFVPVPDQIVNLKGTLLLNTCLEILDQGYSLGSGVYPVDYNSSEVNVECDMTSDGGGWTRWWWYQGSSSFPNETDVLGHNFGTFDASNSYGFQILPSYLTKNETELLAKDGAGTIYKWSFSSTTGTANAVWNSFKNRTQYLHNQVIHSGAWNPTVISGSFTASTQDSWMYREQGGVKGFIMDDDNCDCQTTLNAGPNMCGASWSNQYGDGIFGYGVDFLNDPSCSTPEVNRSLYLFFR